MRFTKSDINEILESINTIISSTNCHLRLKESGGTFLIYKYKDNECNALLFNEQTKTKVFNQLTAFRSGLSFITDKH